MYVVLKRMRQLTQETQNKCITDINYSSKVNPDPAKHFSQQEDSQGKESRKETVK